MNDGRNVANDDQVREWAKTLRAERALTDDAAKAAETLLTLGDESELDAWLARYREARDR